jgi:hypothetical protein
MWNKLVKSLAEYQNAVLTGVDAESYPFSVRCTPQPDPSRQVLHVNLPLDAEVQPGPAWLLCHSHDELLWNLKIFSLRGALERETSGWVFRPERITQAGGTTNPFDMIKSLVKAQRTARKYIQKRGLAWPSVPWKDIQVLRAESKKKEPEAGLIAGGKT